MSLLRDDFRLARLRKQLKAAVPFLTIFNSEAPKHCPVRSKFKLNRGVEFLCPPLPCFNFRDPVKRTVDWCHPQSNLWVCHCCNWKGKLSLCYSQNQHSVAADNACASFLHPLLIQWMLHLSYIHPSTTLCWLSISQVCSGNCRLLPFSQFPPKLIHISSVPSDFKESHQHLFRMLLLKQTNKHKQTKKKAKQRYAKAKKGLLYLVCLNIKQQDKNPTWKKLL